MNGILNTWQECVERWSFSKHGEINNGEQRDEDCETLLFHNYLLIHATFEHLAQPCRTLFFRSMTTSSILELSEISVRDSLLAKIYSQ